MLGKKELTYTALRQQEDGTFDNDSDWVNPMLRPLTIFADKPDSHNPDPADYDLGYDYHGPLIYIPSQCVKTFDFNRPKQPSNQIAIIGRQSNITDSLVNYNKRVN